MADNSDKECRVDSMSVKAQAATLEAAHRILKKGVQKSDIGILTTASNIIGSDIKTLRLHADSKEDVERYAGVKQTLDNALRSQNFNVDKGTLDEIKRMTQEHHTAADRGMQICAKDATSQTVVKR